jgi:GT2 family glycosyltransferase
MVQDNISVIIITWNRRRMLDKMLSYTLEHNDAYEELILVDNGSTDGTSGFVEDKFSSVNVVKLSSNMGVPAARNVGALKAKHNLLFFLDDDGYFDFSSMGQLKRAFRQFNDLAAVGGKVFDIGSEIQVRPDFSDFRPAVSSFKHALKFAGGACLIRKDRFVEVGMFPEHFFYCCEEVDLSYRLMKRGYKIFQCDNAVLLHCNLPKLRKDNPRFFFYHFRNRHFRVWRNLPLIYCLIESMYVIISGLWRARHSWTNFRAFLKGTLASALSLPRVIVCERDPLSLRQYRAYRRLNNEQVVLSPVAKKGVGTGIAKCECSGTKISESAEIGKR